MLLGASRWPPQIVIRYPPRTLTNKPLIIFPMPSLVSLLLRAESDKGQPLTEKEVLAIRDGCACIALPPDVAAGVVHSRGYDDINLDQCWEQWQRARIELSGSSTGE
jgi:hypothetical protein